MCIFCWLNLNITQLKFLKLRKNLLSGNLALGFIINDCRFAYLFIKLTFHLFGNLHLVVPIFLSFVGNHRTSTTSFLRVIQLNRPLHVICTDDMFMFINKVSVLASHLFVDISIKLTIDRESENHRFLSSIFLHLQGNDINHLVFFKIFQIKNNFFYLLIFIYKDSH